MSPSPPTRRLRIGRLDVDLRGIAPATAEAAARALGPALARALTAHHPLGAGAERIDAGRIETHASPDAEGLAASLARRVARALERGTP
jgi:hypothetical protein